MAVARLEARMRPYRLTDDELEEDAAASFARVVSISTAPGARSQPGDETRLCREPWTPRPADEFPIPSRPEPPPPTPTPVPRFTHTHRMMLSAFFVVCGVMVVGMVGWRLWVGGHAESMARLGSADRGDHNRDPGARGQLHRCPRRYARHPCPTPRYERRSARLDQQHREPQFAERRPTPHHSLTSLGARGERALVMKRVRDARRVRTAAILAVCQRGAPRSSSALTPFVAL